MDRPLKVPGVHPGFWLILLLFAISVLPKVLPALYGNSSPDGAVYLNIAENLLSGKGLSLSINLYQGWSDKLYYPAALYGQWLFSFLIAPIYAWGKSLVAVNLFNVVLSGISTVCIYRYLLGQYGRLAALWTAVLIALCPQMLITSIHPWTEQLHLLLLFLSTGLYIKGWEENKGKWVILSGLIAGVNTLVRAGNLLVVAAFFLAPLLTNRKKSLGQMIFFAIGLGIVLLPYQGFCFFTHGGFYPDYLASASVYEAAQTFPGAHYVSSAHGAKLFGAFMKKPLPEEVTNILKHVWLLVCALGPLSVLMIPWAFFVVARRRLFEVLLLLILLIQLLFAAIGTSYLPSTDAFRLSLISMVALLILTGCFCLSPGVQTGISAVDRVSRRYGALIVGIIVLNFTLSTIGQNHFLTDPAIISAKKQAIKDEQQVFDWVYAHSTDRQLVATDYYNSIYLQGRPMVTLPAGLAMNEKNLGDFLRVFRPQCVVTSHTAYAGVYATQGYVLDFQRDYVWGWVKNK